MMRRAERSTIHSRTMRSRSRDSIHESRQVESISCTSSFDSPILRVEDTQRCESPCESTCSFDSAILRVEDTQRCESPRCESPRCESTCSFDSAILRVEDTQRCESPRCESTCSFDSAILHVKDASSDDESDVVSTCGSEIDGFFSRSIATYDRIYNDENKQLFTKLLKWAKKDAKDDTSGNNYCLECFVDMGSHMTRQLCRKYYCNYDGRCYL